jgi:hypothetical protein
MERRHFVSSVAFGFLLGLGSILLYAWVLAPVDFSNANIVDLRDLHKDDYIRMIAAEYMLDGDFVLTKRQLTLLGESDTNARVFDLARAESNPLRQQALIRLYLHLQNPTLVAKATNIPTLRPIGTATLTPRSPRPATTATPIVVPTFTPTRIRPTPEPTLIPPTAFPNPGAPLFRLAEKQALTCREVDESSIQVIVRDTDGNDLAGIAVQVAWATGHDSFYTGVKPERGVGFADYAADPGTYSVRLFENARSEVIEGLQIDPAPFECAGSSNTRGWKLIFTKV